MAVLSIRAGSTSNRKLRCAENGTIGNAITISTTAAKPANAMARHFRRLHAPTAIMTIG